MGYPSVDDVFIRAAPEPILHALTRLSVDASWWPGARARGEYGWVDLDLPATAVGRAPAARIGRVRFRASIGPLREWEGFSWSLEEGALLGRAEWWLAPFGDGAIVHYLLDVERGRARPWGSTPRLILHHRRAIRRGMNALKDALERAG